MPAYQAPCHDRGRYAGELRSAETGEICPGEKGAPAPVRTHPVFEPPLGKYEWLGRQAFVGTLGMAPASEGPAVLIRFYRLK